MLTLCACAGTLADAPSLNKRAFEISLEEMRTQAREGMAHDESVAMPLNLPRHSVDIGLDDDVMMIWHDHKKADADFIAQSSIARAAVKKAQGSEFGSDNWSIAHVEISRLGRVRARSLKSLSALDKIIVAKLENKTVNAHVDRLLQLQKFVQSDVETQSLFVDNLSNALANR